MKNNTKIIATIGPRSCKKNTLKKMIMSGVNVCRLNFSHSTQEEHLKIIQLVKEINRELHVHTAIMADLQGPKIRIGDVKDGVVLEKNNKVIITTKDCLGDNKLISTNYKQLPKDVKKGEIIMIDDGKIHLSVISTNKKDRLEALVVHGGPLHSRKGVNLPNTQISQPCLTEKDLNDLEFILAQPIEWVGLSFVRSKNDLIRLKKIIKANKHNAKVIAKIEKPEAIHALNEIIEESDAIMVARGDLGVEIPIQRVPVLQKKIVKQCLKSSKPVIIATQMLESMIENITPTRAEVNDVANSVMDGADALMLSAETSTGAHPIETIKVMHKIIADVEQGHQKIKDKNTAPKSGARYISNSICFHSCVLAEQVSAEAIITLTHSGHNTFEISSYRPPCKIFAFTNNHSILNTLSLVWGVTGFYFDSENTTDDTIKETKNILKLNKRLKKGQLVINIASMPMKEKGMTNMMKLSYVE